MLCSGEDFIRNLQGKRENRWLEAMSDSTERKVIQLQIASICQKSLLITSLCKWIVEKSLKETIRKNTMNAHVCSRGPSKHDEYFGYVSNPIVLDTRVHGSRAH